MSTGKAGATRAKAKCNILRRNGQLNLADGPDTFISFPSPCLIQITIKQNKKGKTHEDKKNWRAVKCNSKISTDFEKTANTGEELTQQIVRICNLRFWWELDKMCQLTIKKKKNTWELGPRAKRQSPGVREGEGQCWKYRESGWTEYKAFKQVEYAKWSDCLLSSPFSPLTKGVKFLIWRN